jgi:polar amino acid transport system ATP-binding protein
MGFAQRAATKLVFIQQGKIWEEGRPDQLFAAPRTPELAQFLSAIVRD